MSNKALFLELLISGFFAIACFKARSIDLGSTSVSPRNFFRLRDRLERLSITRWQWFSMVLVVMLVRLQSGVPLMVELTAAAQFVIFLALPVEKQPDNTEAAGIRRRKPLASLTAKHVSSGKA